MAPMDNRFLCPRSKGDPDALAYIAAVQQTDGEPLEQAVKTAIEAFVVGCKADSAGYAGDPTRTVWDAIKASCLLCGPRTLSGALVPLRGDAPTAQGGWASGDYDRASGLKGDGSTLYLDSGYNNTAIGQDDRHLAIYRSQGVSPVSSHYEIGAYSTTPSPAHLTAIRPLTGDSCAMYGGGVTGPTVPSPSGYEDGLFGLSRDAATTFTYRTPTVGSVLFGNNSTTPQDQNVFVFSTSLSGTSPFTRSPHRLAFYSIGASLDLPKLDTRISAYVAAIAAAL